VASDCDRARRLIEELAIVDALQPREQRVEVSHHAPERIFGSVVQMTPGTRGGRGSLLRCCLVSFQGCKDHGGISNGFGYATSG